MADPTEDKPESKIPKLKQVYDFIAHVDERGSGVRGDDLQTVLMHLGYNDVEERLRMAHDMREHLSVNTDDLVPLDPLIEAFIAVTGKPLKTPRRTRTLSGGGSLPLPKIADVQQQLRTAAALLAEKDAQIDRLKTDLLNALATQDFQKPEHPQPTQAPTQASTIDASPTAPSHELKLQNEKLQQMNQELISKLRIATKQAETYKLLLKQTQSDGNSQLSPMDAVRGAKSPVLRFRNESDGAESSTDAMLLTGSDAGESSTDMLLLAGSDAGESTVDGLMLLGSDAGESTVDGLTLMGSDAGESSVDGVWLGMNVGASESSSDVMLLNGANTGESSVDGVTLHGFPRGESMADGISMDGTQGESSADGLPSQGSFKKPATSIDYQRRCKEFDWTVRKLREEVANLKKELKKQQKSSGGVDPETQEELEELRDENAHLQKMMEAQKSLMEAQNTNAAVGSGLDSNTLNRKNKEVSELQEQVDDTKRLLNMELERRVIEQKQHADRVAHLETQLEMAKTSMPEVTGEQLQQSTALMTEVARLTVEMDNAREKASIAEGKYAAMQGHLQAVQDALKKRNDQVIQLQERLSAADTHARKAVRAIREMQEQTCVQVHTRKEVVQTRIRKRDGQHVPVDKNEQQTSVTWFTDFSVKTLKSNEFTPEEDRALIQAQMDKGCDWVEIAKMIPGRSDQSLRQRWEQVSQMYRIPGASQAQLQPVNNRQSLMAPNQGQNNVMRQSSNQLVKDLSVC